MRVEIGEHEGSSEITCRVPERCWGFGSVLYI
jgi:hypothetical protein